MGTCLPRDPPCRGQASATSRPEAPAPCQGSVRCANALVDEFDLRNSCPLRPVASAASSAQSPTTGPVSPGEMHSEHKHDDVAASYFTGFPNVVKASDSKNLPAALKSRWILDVAIQLYTNTCTKTHSDFFLMRCVSLSWAFCQVSHLFSDAERQKMQRNLDLNLNLLLHG